MIYIMSYRRHNCGCDKAYLFPYQGYGDLLYDKINIPADEWLDYLMSGRHLAESKSYGDKLRIFNISEYITGREILNGGENIHCIIDDFSDLK